MKKLLFLLMLLPIFVSAQYDSTKNRQTITAYGFDWKNGKFGTLIIPTDTLKMAVKDSNSIASIGGKIYRYNGYYWENTVNVSLPIYVDTLFRQNDSLVFMKNGVAYNLGALNGVDSVWLEEGGSDPDTLRYRFLGATITVGIITAGGSSYTAGVGVKIDGTTIRWGDTLSSTHTVNIHHGDTLSFKSQYSGFPYFGRLSVHSGGAFLHGYDGVNSVNNYIGAGLDFSGVKMISEGALLVTFLRMQHNNWSLGTTDAYPGTDGLKIDGIKDSITVKTNAGVNLFSFFPTSTKSYKLLKYHSYDSASYDDLTHIPKKYLNDRLAAFSTGGTSLNNVGTGYDVAVQGTDNVKRLQAGWGIDLDSATSNVVKISVDTTTQTLTDGATITFDANSGVSAKVTLGGNRTLAFSNFSAGIYLTLVIIQDGTGGRTLTLPAGIKVINGGVGAVTLMTAAAAEDILTFFKIGTTIYCNYGKNYN